MACDGNIRRAKASAPTEASLPKAAAPAAAPTKSTKLVIQEVDEDSSDEEEEDDDDANSQTVHAAEEKHAATAVQSQTPTLASTGSPTAQAMPEPALPENVQALKDKAKSAFGLGHYADALDLYSQALALLENEGQPALQNHLHVLLTNRATVQLKLGNAYACASDCECVLQSDEGHLKARLLRGRALEQREKFADALHDYRFVMHQSGQNQPAQEGIRRVVAAMNAYGLAVPPLETSHLPRTKTSLPETQAPPESQPESQPQPEAQPKAQAAPSNPTTQGESLRMPPGSSAPSTRRAEAEYEALKNEGNRLVRQQQYRDAIAVYARCIKLDPARATAFNNRALCFLKLGEAARALPDAAAVLRLEPENVKAWYRLAQAQIACGQHAEARKSLERVLALEPQNAVAQRDLDALPLPPSLANPSSAVPTATATQGTRKLVIEEVDDDSDSESETPSTAPIPPTTSTSRDDDAQVGTTFKL